MLKSKINTHQLGTRHSQPHFFILNTGNHVGMPSYSIWPNTYVFLAKDESERDFYYYLVQGMEELGLFHAYIPGPEERISIENLIAIIEKAVDAINASDRQWHDAVKILLGIDQKRVKLLNQATKLKEQQAVIRSSAISADLRGQNLAEALVELDVKYDQLVKQKNNSKMLRE